VSAALLAAVGPVDGLRALDVACGHGRMTRELARRGADVVGVDISAALIAKARAAEQERPLEIRYVHEDIASPERLPLTDFDLVVCNIDDLDAALDTISGALRPGGCFVASLLHPCFPAPVTSPARGRRVDGITTRAGGSRTARCPACAAR
jgi:2-polyprenyl-3-methyl-5-hydroxy-6-metoxy-1,4-benzoquinol methylase